MASPSQSLSQERLSAEEVEKFEQDGYLIFRNLCPESLRQEMLAATKEGLAQVVEPVEYEADVEYPGSPASRQVRGAGASTSRAIRIRICTFCAPIGHASAFLPANGHDRAGSDRDQGSRARIQPLRVIFSPRAHGTCGGAPAARIAPGVYGCCTIRTPARGRRSRPTGPCHLARAARARGWNIDHCR